MSLPEVPTPAPSPHGGHRRVLAQRLVERVRVLGATLSWGTEAPVAGDDDAAQRKSWRVLQLLVLTIAFGAFVRNAWVSDDAFIAFRAMYNFDHGLGLVSNVGESWRAC